MRHSSRKCPSNRLMRRRTKCGGGGVTCNANWMGDRCSSPLDDTRNIDEFPDRIWLGENNVTIVSRRSIEALYQWKWANSINHNMHSIQNLSCMQQHDAYISLIFINLKVPRICTLEKIIDDILEFWHWRRRVGSVSWIAIPERNQLKTRAKRI